MGRARAPSARVIRVLLSSPFANHDLLGSIEPLFDFSETLFDVLQRGPVPLSGVSDWLEAAG